MFSDVQIINSGLSKIGSSRISRIDPPQSSLERFVASNYEVWKRSEISKRRWVFALVDDYQLTLTETLTDVAKPYKFQLPPQCLRPVRNKRDEWKQRGRYVHSAYSTLKITLIWNVDEPDFDPQFADVLAARVAVECVEFVTQSNTKKADTVSLYDRAVSDAAKANAFVIGPEDVSNDDDAYPFLTARY